MSLSSSDMLPEMYDEIPDQPNESLTTEISRRNMASYITEKINETVFRLGTMLLRSFHPLHRRVDPQNHYIEPILLLVEKKCENQCEHPEVFYRDAETGLIYCFTLREMHTLINTNSNNPHTNNPFSQNFIDRMKALLKQVKHGLLRERKDDKTQVNGKTLEEKNQLIIPTLWDIVHRQSREYIGNTSIFKFGDGDEPDLEEDDRYFDRDGDSEGDDVDDNTDDDVDTDDDVETSDTSSTVEDDEEMDIDDDATMETITNDEENENVNDNVNDTDVEDNDDDENMGFGASKPIPTNNILCGKCNKDELQLKSIIFDETGANPTLITFCGIECFETYDWPKYKRKD